MKFKNLLLIFSSVLLLLSINTSTFAATNPRIAHTQSAQTNKLGAKYYNDITVINYSAWTLNLTARFLDGTYGQDILQPYGSPGGTYIDYIDLLNDPYAYILISALDGVVLFNDYVPKGRTLKIIPSAAANGKITVTVN